MGARFDRAQGCTAPLAGQAARRQVVGVSTHPSIRAPTHCSALSPHSSSTRVTSLLTRPPCGATAQCWTWATIDRVHGLFSSEPIFWMALSHGIAISIIVRALPGSPDFQVHLAGCRVSSGISQQHRVRTHRWHSARSCEGCARAMWTAALNARASARVWSSPVASLSTQAGSAPPTRNTRGTHKVASFSGATCPVCSSAWRASIISSTPCCGPAPAPLA